MPETRECKCGSALAHALITDRKAIPERLARSWSCWLASICNELLRAAALRGEAMVDGDAARGARGRRRAARFSRSSSSGSAICSSRGCATCTQNLFTEAIGIVAPELMPRRAEGQGSRASLRIPRTRLCAFASHAGRRCCGDQCSAGCGEAALSGCGDSLRRVPKSISNCSRPIARVRHLPAPYPRRARSRDRLRSLGGAVDPEDGIVIDPDSRLIAARVDPVCDDDDYFFFDSRRLWRAMDRIVCRIWPRAGRRKCSESTDAASLYRAAAGWQVQPADITVSLGVGENAAKRFGGRFRARIAADCSAKREPRFWWIKARAPKNAHAWKPRLQPGHAHA